MNTSAPMFVTVSKSNQSFFPESMSNDVVIGVKDQDQRILFGVKDSTSVLRVSSSNVLVNGRIESENVGVGGQIVGTGSKVIFSAIDPGWQVLNDDETGIGIGLQRVQVNAGFLNWGNLTQLNIAYGGNYNVNGENPILLDYSNIPNTAKAYSKNNVSFTGKPISADFAVASDDTTLNMTGPGGVFSFGFHSINTANGTYDENVILRVYYRKSNVFSTFPKYYLLQGSQWMTTSLPSYGGLRIVYHPADNGGNALQVQSGTIFMINRLSIAETLT